MKINSLIFFPVITKVITHIERIAYYFLFISLTLFYGFIVGNFQKFLDRTLYSLIIFSIISAFLSIFFSIIALIKEIIKFIVTKKTIGFVLFSILITMIFASILVMTGLFLSIIFY